MTLAVPVSTSLELERERETVLSCPYHAGSRHSMQLQIAVAFRRCTYSPQRLVSTNQTNRPDGEDAVPTRPGPTVQRRRLGIELRRLREQAGKTIDQVAQVLECSDSKVSRIENGQVSASPRDVRDMLDFYGLDSEHRDALVDMARTARERTWWQAYSDAPVMPLVGVEVAADRIQLYEPMVVHGLLQTEPYARALLRALQPDLSERQIERWVELRMARQRLLNNDLGPQLLVLLEECVLRRLVGGREIMRVQLRHLREVATLQTLTLQVLPLRVGEHFALNGAFSIYHFSDPADPDIVYFEHHLSDLYLEQPAQVARYIAAFDRLRSAALRPDESLSFLASLIQQS
jgi:transcriptional regulator with XRE-family HTH domain